MKKNNTIIEKVEILDESTGQIIVKQRARTIDSDNQVKFIFVSFFLLKKIIIYIFKFKSDEEDELNDFDNIVDSNDDHDLCSINYVSPFLSLSLSPSLYSI